MKRLLIAAIKIRIDWLRVYIYGLIKLCFRRIDYNSFFAAIELYRIDSRLRFFKSIYLNLRTSPWQYAKHMPIWVYGDIKFFDLSGCILPLPDTIVQSGTFIIGHMDPTRSYGDKTAIMIKGTVYYGNKIELRQGAKLRISGELILESGVFIADNSSFYIEENCIIRGNTLIANNVSFMDNDVHYLANVKTRIVRSNVGRIEIGSNNWIGPNTMIKKGSKTCSFLIIVGPGSCLSKDYTCSFNPYDLVAGTPLRVIKSGYMLVFNFRNEAILKDYFLNHDSDFIIKGKLEDFCASK